MNTRFHIELNQITLLVIEQKIAI